MKSFVGQQVGLSNYSAIVSHSSSSFAGLFPSLREMKEYGMDAEHLDAFDLRNLEHSGASRGLYISACNAGNWVNGDLDAISRSSTEISKLMIDAVKWLYEKSKTK